MTTPTPPPPYTAADVGRLRRAVELSYACPPSTTAFSFGAVIVDADGREPASGIRRGVIAWREPDVFVTDCQGARLMRESGVEVIEIPAPAESARAAHAHLRF
ncbi:hypothetical protein ACIPYQ_28585 [Streptomyces sp. NPDC090045]|uniref:hypothetical protein n=1 Tax=Streptomyces sp. NPDC090045 TaxID=3365927 RepID=UPI003819D2B9